MTLVIAAVKPNGIVIGGDKREVISNFSSGTFLGHNDSGQKVSPVGRYAGAIFAGEFVNGSSLLTANFIQGFIQRQKRDSNSSRDIQSIVSQLNDELMEMAKSRLSNIRLENFIFQSIIAGYDIQRDLKPRTFRSTLTASGVKIEEKPPDLYAFGCFEILEMIYHKKANELDWDLLKDSPYEADLYEIVRILEEKQKDTGEWNEMTLEETAELISKLIEITYYLQEQCSNKEKYGGVSNISSPVVSKSSDIAIIESNEDKGFSWYKTKKSD